jgi:hypothetical protein
VKDLIAGPNACVEILVPELERQANLRRVKAYGLIEVRRPQLRDRARYLHRSCGRPLVGPILVLARPGPVEAFA